MTGFDAYDVAVEIAREMRAIVVVIRRSDRSLADQTRRATQSIGLNVAEARGRSGADRTHAFKVALGSAQEARGGLDQASAWGYLPAERTTKVRGLLDREVAMLWRLSGL